MDGRNVNNVFLHGLDSKCKCQCSCLPAIAIFTVYIALLIVGGCLTIRAILG